MTSLWFHLNHKDTGYFTDFDLSNEKEESSREAEHSE